MAKDMRAVRFNEKLKRLSTLIGGAGVALAIGAATRLVDRAADFSTVSWIFSSALLILLSVQMNEMLESEDAD